MIQDFYKEGKIAQKKFKKIEIADGFDKYIDSIFKDAYDYQIEDFIRGLLDKTKNHSLFIRAFIIATDYPKENIWARVIQNFNQLIKGKNKPNWSFEYISSLVRHPEFKISNYHAELLVFMFFRYDDGYSGWWFGEVSDKPWFNEIKANIRNAILNVSNQLNPKTSKGLFDHFKSMYFYKQIIENDKDDKFFNIIISKLVQYSKLIEGFDSFEIDLLMTNHKDKFVNNSEVMDSLSVLLEKYQTNNTAELFLIIIEESNFNKDDMIRWLENVLYFHNSESIRSKLYELTQDEEYLPQTAKDVFLF